MPENLPITTMLFLLEVLHIDASNSRKTRALVVTYRAGKAEVHESFNDGNVHCGIFSRRTSSLDWDVLVKAKEAGYVAGTPESGHVSRSEFQLSESGEQEFLRLRSEADATKKAVVQTEPSAA